jgi:hypothetical protein
MHENLRELIKVYVDEELSTTDDASVYSTPKIFKKKKKKVTEALESKDVTYITKLIRDVVGDILRDIWLKRTSWK